MLSTMYHDSLVGKRTKKVKTKKLISSLFITLPKAQ